MNVLTVLLILGGIYHLCFGLFHAMFWRFKFLNWQEELLHMSGINRAVIQMLNVAVVVFMILVAYLSIRYAEELPTTNLGRDVLLGVSIFWLARLGGEFTLKDSARAEVGIVVACIIGILLYLTPAIMYMNK